VTGVLLRVLSPLMLLLLSTYPALAVDGYISVLLYHRFDEPQYPSTNIQVEQFRQQLALLRDGGYRVISAAEFCSLIDTATVFPERTVLITIDDSHRSVFTGAYPVLREAGLPFAVFANVSALYSDSAAHMNWEMLEEMAANGAEVGNHSYYHPHIGRPRAGQDSTGYAQWVQRDLRRARDALRDHGLGSQMLAFPYGEYNQVVVEAARDLGYRYLFTQDEGAVDQQTSPGSIARVPIVGANMDLERFAYKLSLSPLHVDGVEPRGGFLAQNPPGAFALRLREPERYRPGVVNMFISEWGRVPAVYRPEDGWISFSPDSALTRPCNRVIVTARERGSGAYSMFSRLHVLPLAQLLRP
jgi:peptidoglycan/xylan/chitin deacetylase (PgdA/CDA1 family)